MLAKNDISGTMNEQSQSNFLSSSRLTEDGSVSWRRVFFNNYDQDTGHYFLPIN
jgi:hypothetical protein